ncbi:MAG: flavin reductase [Bacteroidales bacterium]|nr:flavin reductase [Bacteroidales bacterium]MCM1415951.1 flavin reductase [bacterium]MCM1422780.1 flavin reductase [bacterium]
MNTKALQKLPYGLYVAASKFDRKMNGCIVNTVMQVTSKPLQIATAINKDNLTCEIVQNSKILTLSLLSESAPFSLFQHFGFQSGRDTDKFVDYPFAMTKQELPYIKEHTAAFFDCKVVNSIDLGTHILFICTVEDCEILSDEKPMTYAYYHESVKPKPEASVSKGWRCKICGYVYEGEELPPDFVCPLCKHGAEDFEKIV